MARKPSYFDFDKASYPWKPDINYREHPEQYRVGRGEQGVLICQPYKDEFVGLWRFKTPDHAEENSQAIWTRMGRRGNPYDNAKAESFIKTLKVEAIYPMAFENFDDAAEHLPRFIEGVYNKRRLHSALGYLSPQQFEDQRIRQSGKSAA